MAANMAAQSCVIIFAVLAYEVQLQAIDVIQPGQFTTITTYATPQQTIQQTSIEYSPMTVPYQQLITSYQSLSPTIAVEPSTPVILEPGPSANQFPQILPYYQSSPPVNFGVEPPTPVISEPYTQQLPFYQPLGPVLPIESPTPVILEPTPSVITQYQQVPFYQPFEPPTAVSVEPPTPVIVERTPSVTYLSNLQPSPFAFLPPPVEILQPPISYLSAPGTLLSSPTITQLPLEPPTSVILEPATSVLIDPPATVTKLPPPPIPLVPSPPVTLLPSTPLPLLSPQTLPSLPSPQTIYSPPSLPLILPTPPPVAIQPPKPVPSEPTSVPYPLLTPPPSPIPPNIPSPTYTVQPPLTPTTNLISTTVVDNSLANNLANLLQLFVTSRLISSQMNPCTSAPFLNNVASLFDAIGNIGTTNTYSQVVQYPYYDSFGYDLMSLAPVNLAYAY